MVVSYQIDAVHDGAMPSIAPRSNSSSRLSFASSSEKMSPIWQACSSRGAAPNGLTM